MFSQSLELKKFDVFISITDKIEVEAISPEDAIEHAKMLIKIDPRALASYNVAIEHPIENK